MKHLASLSKSYSLGITGKFDKQGGNYLTLIGQLQKKVNQIQTYCKKWRVPVTVYIDENTPFSFYSYLYTTGVKSKPVTLGESEDYNANIVVTKDIQQFFENQCDYIMIFCDKEEQEDFEFEKPHKFLTVLPSDKKESRLTPDPAIVLREAIQKTKTRNDPYSIFFHEKLYQVVPYTHYNDLMESMPDINDLTSREFANVDKKP